jgi:hypothetical protein
VSNSEQSSRPGKVRIRPIRGGLPTTIISAALVASGVLFATTGSGAATTPVSQSTGRFLTGTIGGTNLDTLAAIKGEAAQNDGSVAAVTNANSLNASVLNDAIKIPLADGLQLPGLDILQLGAVAQYAQALGTGAAHGASGAVDNQGGIGVGGANGVPSGNATLDLTGLGGGAVSDTLVGLKAEIGAISATAEQAAGVGGVQGGDYNIAGLKLHLNAPVLATAIQQLDSAITTGANSIAPLLTLNVPGVGNVVSIECPNPIGSTLVCVNGTQNVAALSTFLNTTLSLPSGCNTAVSYPTTGACIISVNLANGDITLDVAQLLKSINLDINSLDPNTSLLPYIGQALALLPDAISSLVTGLTNQLTTAFGGLGIYVAGLGNLSGSALTTALAPVLNSVLTPLTSALSSGASQLGSTVLSPLFDQLKALLDLIVNVQDQTGGKFSETALQLILGNGAGALSSSLPTGIPTSFPSLPAPGSAFAKPLAGSVRAVAAPAAAHVAAAPAAAPAAVSVFAAPVDTSNALAVLNLANATVGPNAAVPTSTASVIPTPSGANPGPTSSIHIQSGGGIAQGALKPVTHDDNRRPLGIALAALGLVGLAVPRRRRIVELMARGR